MKHLKKYKLFEAVIMPQKLDNNSNVNSLETLVQYGQENSFDAVEYDEFYDSLDEIDKKTAPPRHGVPFFALFHPIRKKPMFVLVDKNAAKFIPNFKSIVDDIIGHELVHAEQNRRKGDIDYSLPSPTNRKEYFSNKEEIMAFSWSIANGLAQDNRNTKDAIKDLFSGGSMRNFGPPKQHKMLWNDITKFCDEKVLKRYKKYIYQYLEEMFKKED